MGKEKSHFVCQACGASFARWSGRCEGCGEWNTITEEAAPVVVKGKGARRAAAASAPQAITEVSGIGEDRRPTGLEELDRVLGGGIVAGSVVLVGGDPGIGKSTLMMQVCAPAADSGLPAPRVLYVSGEESPRQIRMRAERLGALSPALLLLAETDLTAVIAALDATAPELVVIDSIQTMYRPEMESAPGSISQVRECAALLQHHAKRRGVPVFLIGHVTKDGMIAGPRVLEHMVDTVLQFEGDNHHAYRIVRAAKNRFGSTNEIGIFEMRDSGLREVRNASEVLLSERSRGISGSCVCACIEGTRPLLVEAQALVTPSNFGLPQRTVAGIDGKRLSLLLAVLEKRFGLRTGQYDVFANIAGGVKIDEPAADLALAAAVVSSARDAVVDPGTVVVGEIGLGGEIRSVASIEKRISESEKLGFARMLLPRGNYKEQRRGALRLVEVGSLAEAMTALFE